MAGKSIFAKDIDPSEVVFSRVTVGALAHYASVPKGRESTAFAVTEDGNAVQFDVTNNPVTHVPLFNRAVLPLPAVGLKTGGFQAPSYWTTILLFSMLVDESVSRVRRGTDLSISDYEGGFLFCTEGTETIGLRMCEDSGIHSVTTVIFPIGGSHGDLSQSIIGPHIFLLPPVSNACGFVVKHPSKRGVAITYPDRIFVHKTKVYSVGHEAGTESEHLEAQWRKMDSPVIPPTPPDMLRIRRRDSGAKRT